MWNLSQKLKRRPLLLRVKGPYESLFFELATDPSGIGLPFSVKGAKGKLFKFPMKPGSLLFFLEDVVIIQKKKVGADWLHSNVIKEKELAGIKVLFGELVLYTFPDFVVEVTQESTLDDLDIPREKD